MKYTNSLYIRFFQALLLGVLSLTLAASGGCKEENPLTLKQVMNGLEKDMIALNRAVYVQDFAGIEKYARMIAQHPQPMKAQRKKIIKHLDERAERFQGYDLEVHSAALQLADAALAQSPAQISQLALQVQAGCYGCHFEFQKEISALLAEPHAAPEAVPETPAAPEPTPGEATGE